MGKVQTLRLRRTHDIEYSLDQFLGSDIGQTGFCLEGWVNFAPMDNRARVYPEARYSGKPLLLKPGTYPKLTGRHFRELRLGDKPKTEETETFTLASLDLPEGVEAVFFSEPNFKGDVFPFRDDEHTIDGGEKKVASALVLDRRHRQQSHVVLFTKAAYEGQAQVLQAPHSWTIGIQSEEDTGSTALKPSIPFSSFHQSRDISSIGSAWVPPGIALDLLSISKTAPGAFTPIAQSELKMSDKSQRDPEDIVKYAPQAWYQDVPAFTEVEIPDGLALYLFEKEIFGGRYRILSKGAHKEIGKNQWTPHSAVLAAAPNGTEGALVFDPIPQVVPPDTKLPKWEEGGQEFAEFWFPTGFALVKELPGRQVISLQGGFYQRKAGETLSITKLQRTTLRGDLSKFPNAGQQQIVKITARRSTPLGADIKAVKDREMSYQAGGEEIKEKAKYWQNAASVPQFTSVRVPLDMALFLFSEEKGRGNYEVIVGGKDDFSDLSITPKSAALVDASAGLYGVLWLKDGAKHEKRIFPSGSVFDDAIGNAYLFIPPGYRLVPKGGLSTLGEVAANPDKPVFVDGYRVEAYVGLFSNNGNGLAVQRSHGALRAGSDELRFGGRILQPECWYHLAYCYQPSTQAGQGSVHFLVNGKNVQTIKEVKISDYTKQVADAADWRIGRQLRGSLAGLRVWKINRNADTISRERHGLPEVEVIAELMKDLIAKDRYSGSDMASLRGDLNTLIEQEKYSQTEVDAVLVTKVNALISQQPSAGAKLRVFRKEAEKLFSEIRHAQEIQGKVQLVLNDVEEIVRKGQEDAIAVEAELSAPPKESRLFKNVLNKLEVQRAQELEAAHQKAAAAKNLAEKRSQYKIAVARDQARRRVHLDAVDRMVFVRGGKVVVNDPALSTKENPLVFKVLKAGTDAYPLDFSIVKDSEGKTIYLIADSWNNAILLCKDKSGEDKLEIYGSISPDKRPDGYTPRTPQAVICDASGTHGEAESGGVVRKAVYWVEEDGSFYRYWDDGSAIESSERNQVVKLIDPIATGQYRSWDLTFYRNDSQQLLIWCNGWEIFELKAGPESTGTGPVDRSKIKLLVPHTLSPHPVAVATDPEGNLVWLDAQEERVRFLPRGAQLPIDLYAAPNPTRGLSVCRIPGGEKPITYVYWVSALRRTLEVPVLDTPGRYIDLWQNAKKPVPHGQHVPLVAVDEEEELEWIEAVELFRLPIPVQIRVSLEPDRGYLVKMKMKLNKTQEEIKELYSKYYKTFKLLNDDSSFNSSLTIELFRLSGSNKTEEFELPTGRWFDLEIHYQVKEVKWYYGRTRKEYTIIVKADDEILCRKEVGILTAYYPKFKLFETKSYTNFDSDLGELAEVTVIRTDDDKEVMYWSPYEERSVSYGWRNSSLSEPKKKVVDKAGNEGLKAFRKVIDFQQDSDGRLKFEPIRLDLRKGWTAAADLIWHGKAAGTYNHTCLYELATFENECRLICSLDADGSPVLVIFWNGQQVTPAFNFEGFPGRGLEIGKMHRLCWTYDPKGEIYTYIDGRPATKVQLSLAMEPKVWEHQSLGAPNPYQFDKRVDTAAVQAAKNLFEEPEVSFQSFNGWVARFGAWNTFEPAAITDWDKAAPYDPSWDRSLVTIQSRYRYLQAGRLDGKETAVTLFPLDMDGGLNITTKLDSRRAAYNLAQVELAAAEAHAVKLKEAAFREARADLARAEADLAATQQQTDKDLAVARQKKIMAEEAARFDKIQAHANAELKKRQGVREANGERESGRRQAESQEVAAADDKKRRIGEKAHERNQKRSERDKKRNEAEGHGLL